MIEFLKNSLNQFDEWFYTLESKHPSPVLTEFNGEGIYKYSDESIPTALLLKLARIVTGLRSSVILLEHGMIQEQAVIARTTDEIADDINYLCLSYALNENTRTLQQYLSAFYELEIPDPQDSSKPLKKPN